MPMMDELLTIEEAAQVIKCGRNMVYNLMNKGYLEYLVLGHREVRRKTLEAFMEKYEGYDLSDLDNPKIIERGKAV